VNGTLQGRLEDAFTMYTNLRSSVPFSADNFDDHDAGVACLTLGFG